MKFLLTFLTVFLVSTCCAEIFVTMKWKREYWWHIGIGCFVVAGFFVLFSLMVSVAEEIEKNGLKGIVEDIWYGDQDR